MIQPGSRIKVVSGVWAGSHGVIWAPINANLRWVRLAGYELVGTEGYCR
jgi:hypothetical protein